MIVIKNNLFAWNKHPIQSIIMSLNIFISLNLITFFTKIINKSPKSTMIPIHHFLMLFCIYFIYWWIYSRPSFGVKVVAMFLYGKFLIFRMGLSMWWKSMFWTVISRLCSRFKAMYFSQTLHSCDIMFGKKKPKCTQIKYI